MTEIYMPLMATASAVTGYVPSMVSAEEGKVINVIQGLVEVVQVCVICNHFTLCLSRELVLLDLKQCTYFDASYHVGGGIIA